MTVGYSRLLKDALVRLKGRISAVYTTFGRPLLTGRRLAVELASEGIRAYSWPDAYIASLVDIADYVILASPGISVNGVVALDLGAYPALALARRLGRQVILVACGLSIIEGDVARNADRKVRVKLTGAEPEAYVEVAPFEYTSITDVDVVITGVGSLLKASSGELSEAANRSRSLLVDLAFKSLS